MNNNEIVNINRFDPSRQPLLETAEEVIDMVQILRSTAQRIAVIAGDKSFDSVQPSCELVPVVW